jgi:hypothetical protein
MPTKWIFKHFYGLSKAWNLDWAILTTEILFSCIPFINIKNLYCLRWFSFSSVFEKANSFYRAWILFDCLKWSLWEFLFTPIFKNTVTTKNINLKTNTLLRKANGVGSTPACGLGGRQFESQRGQFIHRFMVWVAELEDCWPINTNGWWNCLQKQ